MTKKHLLIKNTLTVLLTLVCLVANATVPDSIKQRSGHSFVLICWGYGQKMNDSNPICISLLVPVFVPGSLTIIDQNRSYDSIIFVFGDEEVSDQIIQYRVYSTPPCWAKRRVNHGIGHGIVELNDLWILIEVSSTYYHQYTVLIVSRLTPYSSANCFRSWEFRITITSCSFPVTRSLIQAVCSPVQMLLLSTGSYFSIGYGLAVLSFSFRLNKLTAFSALFLYQPNSSPILQ